MALREHKLFDTILGYDASEQNSRDALELGLADKIVDIDEGVAAAELIVLAIPVDAIPMAATKILNKITEHQTLMDMGSTKGELCEVVSMHARRARLVATHPMWGTEYSGPKSARSGAFKGRRVVICERERSADDARRLVENIYTTIGMPIIYMEAEEHDIHTAYISHISHVSSFALALTVLEKEREENHIFDLASGGFESTVRLAKSPASMWVPIFMRNKYNLLDVLREHIHQLQIMRQMIERDDVKALTEIITRANSILKILK